MNLYSREIFEIIKITIFNQRSFSMQTNVTVEVSINFNNLILSLLVTTIFNVVIKKVAKFLLGKSSQLISC